MEGEIDVNAKLDYATFQISSTQNRYEVVICGKGRTERLASGSLDQLSHYLVEAKQFQTDSSNGTFILEPKQAPRGSSWFNKSTLAIFLHIVGSPEALLSASGTLSEMSQLEETRKFHLSLYSKDDLNHVDVGFAGGLLKDVRVTQQMRGETVSSDATKNELLRALELRLTALKEEMVSSFNRAAGSNLSTKHISDLITFSQHFGAMELRNLLANYLVMISTNQPAEVSLGPLQLSHESKEMNEKPLETSQSNPQASNVEHVSVSPAKLAQVERMSSTESGESSDWSDEDQRAVERSRSFVRTAPHRRSASPMRRIQIGRSGSRRSTALAIKNLSLFPVLSTKEASKTAAPRRASLKSPLPPAALSSRSSVPLPKSTGVQPHKSSPGSISTSLKKTQTSPYSVQPSPKAERSTQQVKAKRGTLTHNKPVIEGREDLKLGAGRKSRNVKTVNKPALDYDTNTTAKTKFSSIVAKKSSVIPVEQKTLLRKGPVTGPAISPSLGKSKASRADDSQKGNTSVTTEANTKVSDVVLAQTANDVDANLQISLYNDLNIQMTEILDQSLAASEDVLDKEPVKVSTAEIQQGDKDTGISTSAWVKVEHNEVPFSCENGLLNNVSTEFAPISSISPGIRHSQSQMVKADCNEPEIVEWGNTQIPPSFIYQRDAPKGLRRLLKFAQKSKREANVTDLVIPSDFSEIENDLQDSNGANMKNLDCLSGKVSHGCQKTPLSGNLDCGNLSKREIDICGMHDNLSAQSSSSFSSLYSDKLRESHAPSPKGSFFSLSKFRSSKSSGTKPR